MTVRPHGCAYARNQRIRDRPATSSGGPFADGPMQAEDSHGMDSGSDVASSEGSDSEGSDTSREACSMQRKPPPLPSIRCAKDAASSRQSGVTPIILFMNSQAFIRIRPKVYNTRFGILGLSSWN